jgi:hypothetical protein
MPNGFADWQADVLEKQGRYFGYITDRFRGRAIETGGHDSYDAALQTAEAYLEHARTVNKVMAFYLIENNAVPIHEVGPGDDLDEAG